MGETSEEKTPLGYAIEASRPIEGTDLHEVRIRAGAPISFLAIVGDVNGEAECGLIYHSQPACDLHVIRGRELLPIHSASGEMALAVLLSLIESVGKQYNPYPGARLSEQAETIKVCLWRAQDALSDAVSELAAPSKKCRCGHPEAAHYLERSRHFVGRVACGFLSCHCEDFARA